MTKEIGIRILKDRIFTVGLVILAVLATLPLFSILVYVYRNGLPFVSWRFLTSLPKPPGEAGGGISNAVVGTLLLIPLSALVSVPLAVATGIFLAENQNNPIAQWVRTSVEVLQGVPSVVIGIVAYLWVVKKMGGFSLLSGAVALGIMMLPVIVKTTEETLRLVPHSLKEASLALGVPYYKTVLKVVLPCGLSGIVTGILVSTARISGETAPLLFTAFGNPFMNLNPLKATNTLPLLVFNYATSPYSDWHNTAWGASVVLITLVLILNLIARVGTKKWKIQF